MYSNSGNINDKIEDVTAPTILIKCVKFGIIILTPVTPKTMHDLDISLLNEIFPCLYLSKNELFSSESKHVSIYIGYENIALKHTPNLTKFESVFIGNVIVNMS